MKTASVIGWPISHSRSPLIHSYWLRQHAIEGLYEKCAVEPENLSDFIHSLRTGTRVGTNVTIPHKETAVSFVDVPDDRVRRIGSLNTIWRENNKLFATSTDGAGFVANVLQHIPAFSFEGKIATILGAGGSTRALVDELLRCDVKHIHIQNRTHAKAEHIAQHFGPQVTAQHHDHLAASLELTDILINTTAVGMNSENSIPLPWQHLNPSAIVADIVYTPLITPFLQTAKAHHHAIIPGLGMLLHQAVIGFEKWFGVKPIVTQELYSLVARDIDPDYQP